MARWGPTVRYNTTPIDFSGAVEGFMQARRDAQQNKRRQAMEERDSDLFDLDMLDRGYTRTDPALLQQERDAGITAPMPGQVGGYRKTGFSRDERAGIAKVAEQERVRQEADARRGRARGTAQRLGFQGDEAEFLADNEDTLARELLALRAAGRKPAAVPKFSELQDRSGEFVFFDPATGQRINSGVMGRVPGSGTGGVVRGKPLPATAVTRISDWGALRDAAREAIGAFFDLNPETGERTPNTISATGFLQGRVASLAGQLGVADQQSVSARSKLANIATSLGKLRSGGAITPQEFERLEAFLPNKNDDEDTVRTKLIDLESYLTNVLQQNLDTYEEAGYDVARSRGRLTPPQAVAPAQVTPPAVPRLDEVMPQVTAKPPIREFINRNRQR